MVKASDDNPDQKRGTGMNAYARAAQNYSSVKVQSGVDDASPHRLIQMLFEGALERIAQAKGAMQQERHTQRAELIRKAVNIVMALQGSLNDDEGGDMTADLDNLYDYIVRTLLFANVHSDPAKLDECGRLLGEIKSAWDGIAPEAR